MPLQVHRHRSLLGIVFSDRETSYESWAVSHLIDGESYEMLSLMEFAFYLEDCDKERR